MTGSAGLDGAVFVVLLALMLVLAPRLGVYYGVTVNEVTLERIPSGGVSSPLPLPAEFDRIGGGEWSHQRVVERLGPMIDRYMAESEAARSSPPGTRFVFTVRTAGDGARPGQVDRITRETPP